MTTSDIFKALMERYGSQIKEVLSPVLDTIESHFEYPGFCNASVKMVVRDPLNKYDDRPDKAIDTVLKQAEMPADILTLIKTNDPWK